AFSVTRDWVGNARANILAWWIPKAAIVVALLAPVPVRAVAWIAALVWMGTACMLNARRCGRTHCRYWTFLSRDDRTSRSIHHRHYRRQSLRLACACRFYTPGWLDHLVGH